MIRIAIVDDHPTVRAGLRRFFADQVDFTVVAEAGNGRDALDIVRAGDVDVVLMDIAMPGQSGVDALVAIKLRAPELPVLILSGFPEAHYATTLIRQGASGYLNKDCDPEEIVRAIRTVARGRKYITAGVAEQLAEGIGSAAANQPLHTQLSDRELLALRSHAPRPIQTEAVNRVAHRVMPTALRRDDVLATVPGEASAANAIRKGKQDRNAIPARLQRAGGKGRIGIEHADFPIAYLSRELEGIETEMRSNQYV